jgi:dTDP-L-rhamnose 4-epimerase
MTPRKVLVTGGAGFIGSHLVAALAAAGHRVRVLDALDPQVHGTEPLPGVTRDAEMIRGDLRDGDLLERALDGIEVVFHQAAAVGVGQSMYQAAAYTSVNCQGTALLMEKMAARRSSRVEKVVVASSMSVYGEGGYVCRSCGPASPGPRDARRLKEGRWEPPCPACGEDLLPVPTVEEKPLGPTSVYAVTKRFQEETVLVMGRAYGIPAVALRYFNVYGPGQALSNPYTGVAAIFSARLLNGLAPVIFEDGGQGRDFTHVSDVVQANLLAMEKDQGNGEVFNVGTGRLTPLLDLARGLQQRLAPQTGLSPRIAGTFREGDIRHCYADISRIRTRLGFEPKVFLEQGFDDLASWARTQRPEDRFEQASGELLSRGLLRAN